MKRITIPAALVFLLAVSIAAAAQPAHQTQPTTAAAPTAQETASRNATREKLRHLLDTAGPKINVAFKQSDKNPYNFFGTMSTGLTNADGLEVLISVTPKETIAFRVYPHYKGGYINVDKARDRTGLMRLLLRLSDRAFLYWGADETGDVFTGYTFTLESGFPEEAIDIVLRSIVNSDTFVGEMKSSIN
jgi:hypothetical protein